MPECSAGCPPGSTGSSRSRSSKWRGCGSESSPFAPAARWRSFHGERPQRKRRCESCRTECMCRYRQELFIFSPLPISFSMKIRHSKSVWLQTSASIQPRRSPVKFDSTDPPSSSSSLRTERRMRCAQKPKSKEEHRFVCLRTAFEWRSGREEQRQSRKDELMKTLRRPRSVAAASFPQVWSNFELRRTFV